MAQKRNSKKEKVYMEEQASHSGRSWRSSVSKLKHPSQFSKPQLLIFVLAFALIGYLIFRTFAAAPVIATLQAEQMTPSGGTVTVSSGFMTSLKNNGTITTPYLWTFNPGVDTGAGYFFANGKLLKKIVGPGPYVLRINSGMLKAGTNKLGHAWDTTTGVHQTPPTSYSEKVNNVSGGGFVTTLTNNVTINAPYVWAFDPGVATSAGYFFSDGTQIAKLSGAGPYAVLVDNSDNLLLSAGAHKLGHAWDTTAGVHQTPPSAYSITYNPGTSATVNSSVISDSTASGGQAVKFGGGVTLTGSVNLPGQAASVTIMAHGEQCSTVWPQMNVKVDGQSVLSTTVSSTSWTPYNINLTLNGGSHTLAIINTSSGSCQPNLYADVTNFYGPNVVANPPTVSLSASPSTISSGQASTLTWSSTNATSCTASGAWSGSQPTSGTVSTGTLSQSSTFTLTCVGAGGSAIANTSVTVNTVTSTTNYDAAIAYTQTRPAFTPIRTINVSDATGFKNAIAGLQAGDLVKATANFTVSGETVINKRLSAPAVIDLSGYTVSFVYTGTSNLPAIWMSHASNLRIYGGDLSTSDTGGVCLNISGSDHILWWGWKAHDCGSSGMTMFTLPSGANGSGPVEYNDIQGETWKFAQNPAWDPHQEKCTGLHGANLADSNYFPFDNNRVALYAHDSACEGAGIEFGSSQSTNIPTHNTIYLKCVNLTFISTIQTGGNCYQTWGYGNTYNDIKYLEADNLTGHPYWAGGMSGSASATALSTDTVDFGRATNVRQNSRYATDPNWDKRWGTVFKDVSPTP